MLFDEQAKLAHAREVGIEEGIEKGKKVGLQEGIEKEKKLAFKKGKSN